MSFIDYASGIQLPYCAMLARNWKNHNGVTIHRHDVIIKVLWSFFLFPVKLGYWSKFHVNIITGSGVMTIFFYKGLNRNPEIGITPICVLPNIWGLGWVRDTKFGTNVSDKLLLNSGKCQGCSFYRFWVTKGKPTGGGVKSPPATPNISRSL